MFQFGNHRIDPNTVGAAVCLSPIVSEVSGNVLISDVERNIAF